MGHFSRGEPERPGPATIPKEALYRPLVHRRKGTSSAAEAPLAKFWAPVPWLLEGSIILEVVLQKYEAEIIAGLLVLMRP